MPKEFIMRGQTAVADPTEVLNITGYRPGYGYVIKEFQIYPSTTIIGATYEMSATITADNSAEAPADPNFNNEGLIASALIIGHPGAASSGGYHLTVINDLFVITQDLILMVADTQSSNVNWQVRFKEVKLSGPAEAVANYKQYTIYNTSS
ncbi:MAG TPA: hypothetical protein EYN67_15105 [Flavobacteriales bacterium]|nr:hypothetical protein [Flavobacteriales bacterium]